MLLATALSAGTTALISRYWGERDLKQTIAASRQSLIFGCLFGSASAGAGMLLARPIMHVLGASTVVENLGWEYMKYDMSSQLPYTLLWVFNSIFRAKGDARVPMIIMAGMTALVIALDFILCIYPFHVGIAGLGISWLVAAFLGVTASYLLILRTELAPCVDIRQIISSGISLGWFVRLMKIGLPACIQDLSWIGSNFMLYLIFALTANPTACQAAWAVGLRVDEIIGGFPIYALSMAVATIVGQNLGAKQPQRAERAGWHVCAVGAALNCVVAAILFFFAAPIASLMSNDPTVIAYSSSYLRIVGLCLPLCAAWIIMGGAMQGAGYTRWPMLATICCLCLIRLPLAWYLTVPLAMGPTGTWIAISASTVLLGLLMVWRFSSGIWKLQKV